MFSRRRFTRTCAAAGITASCALPTWPVSAIAGPDNWNKLQALVPVAPQNLALTAAIGRADDGGGTLNPAWLLNGMLPSPFLRVRRGEAFRVTLQNELPEPLILHWHGLTPPEQMDGHPRLAVPTNGKYEYSFTVENRAGTYWYHSHSHHRVGKHAYFGIAGMLIVDDEEADALQLPSGVREVPLILQDRRVDDAGSIQPYGDPDTMEGMIGNEPFGNGTRRPSLEVDTALYRFRILNGANARIFRLARSDGKNMVIIGNDAGLLDKPMTVTHADISPGERLDVLLDLRDMNVGDYIRLGSEPFIIEHGLASPYAIYRQGHPMEVLELRVKRKVRDDSVIPERFPPVPGPDPADAVREREFILTSDRDSQTRTMMAHHINGRAYAMDRVDVEVPFGETEIWSFINRKNFSHPIHLHATHFRVLSRTGGRNQVMPWERGLKDTVLIHPEEHVRVAVRFNAHQGLFLLHCHNLEHEDTGMMLNVLVKG